MKKTILKLVFILFLMIFAVLGFNTNTVKAVELGGDKDHPYNSIDDAFTSWLEELHKKTRENKGISTYYEMDSLLYLWSDHVMKPVYAKDEDGNVITIENSDYELTLVFRNKADDSDKEVKAEGFEYIKLTEDNFEYGNSYYVYGFIFTNKKNNKEYNYLGYANKMFSGQHLGFRIMVKNVIKSAILPKDKYTTKEFLVMSYKLSDKDCKMAIKVSKLDKEKGEYDYINGKYYTPKNDFLSINLSQYEVGKYRIDINPYYEDDKGEFIPTPSEVRFFEIIDFTFTDVNVKDWFYEAVLNAKINNYIKGYDENTFAPNDNLTRGMMVTILYRMDGAKANDGKSKFEDVDSESWYAEPIKWAVENGIIHGYEGTNNFGPNDNIIRQDLAGILRNYAVYKKLNVTAKGDLTKFSDNESVSDYAKTSMQWAVGAGVITGNANGTLNPKGNATRAETAAMVVKYSTKVGK